MLSCTRCWTRCIYRVLLKSFYSRLKMQSYEIERAYFIHFILLVIKHKKVINVRMCIVKIFYNIYVHSNQNKDKHNDVVSPWKKCLNYKKKNKIWNNGKTTKILIYIKGRDYLICNWKNLSELWSSILFFFVLNFWSFKYFYSSIVEKPRFWERNYNPDKFDEIFL